MNYSPLEFGIIAFIVVMLAIVIWRGGMANPEGTGTLGRKLGTIKTELAQVQSEVKTIAGRVTEIDRRAATTGDIDDLKSQISEQAQCLKQLDESLNALGISGAAREATLDAVRQQVQMIYQVIVPKGMK